jgi:hypothetical protein
LVNGWARAENQNLCYLRNNQTALRADTYRGVTDALDRDVNPNNIGRSFILPSSFHGGPRHMQQCYQDAMGIVRRYGKPDLFITMTCNPKWPEITAALKPGQHANDRPELMARVFKMKLDMLMSDLTKEEEEGEAHAQVVEFQKRGLPQGVMQLLWEGTARANGRLACSRSDRSCSCPSTHTPSKQRLHVQQQHGCPLQPLLAVALPVPHQRGGLHQYQKRQVLYKYVYKGHDRAVVEVQAAGGPPAGPAGAAAPGPRAPRDAPRDEIKEYLDGRYCSASEAAWRLYAFPMHTHSPPVVRLAVHLPGEQTVVINPQRPAAALNAGATTLTSWLKFNATVKSKPAAERSATANAALASLYHDFPTHAVLKGKVWKERERAPRGGVCPVGRMYYVPPGQGERYYLRTLLSNVAGATSFEDLRTTGAGTPNETLHPTFKAVRGTRAAARRRGMGGRT